ncbi:MAG: alpha-L-fucosidase, partial [Caulobacter sp.]|nr:alpha-L-fucosidase [Caulobacter sp.]
ADAAWLWEPDKLNRMVRRHQPNIVINPRSGWQGDFDVQEGLAPITGPIRQRPWEKAFSLSRAWGYTPDGDVMSSDQVVRLLVDAVVRNGNVIANVGPDRDGVIGQRETETLRSVGQWLQQHGAAIYGTRPGPLEPVDGLYGTTRSGKSVFLHILSWPSEELRIPRLPARIVKARNLSGGPVAWKTTDDGHTISVPEAARGRPVTIIELQTA